MRLCPSRRNLWWDWLCMKWRRPPKRIAVLTSHTQHTHRAHCTHRTHRTHCTHRTHRSHRTHCTYTHTHSIQTPTHTDTHTSHNSHTPEHTRTYTHTDRDITRAQKNTLKDLSRPSLQSFSHPGGDGLKLKNCKSRFLLKKCFPKVTKRLQFPIFPLCCGQYYKQTFQGQPRFMTNMYLSIYRPIALEFCYEKFDWAQSIG